MDDEKLIDIEVRIAHQDQLLHELNEVLTRQQAQISALEGRLESLLTRVRDIAAAAPAPGADERPPHY